MRVRAYTTLSDARGKEKLVCQPPGYLVGEVFDGLDVAVTR